MKLAFCLFNYFPYGGLERNFMATSLECIKRGHCIDVYTMQWDGDKPECLNIIPVPARGVSNHRKAASFASYLSKHLNHSHYDLVMGFNKIPNLDLYYTADVCYAARIQNQRGFLAKLTPRYHVFTEFERAVFGQESKTEIIYLSGQEKKLYQEIYGTQESRFHYAPPGINKDNIRNCLGKENRSKIRSELKLTEADTLLLMIGSNFGTKGVDRSIRALASLPDPIQKTTFLFIVGKGKQGKYERLSHSLGVAGNIHFLGVRDDVPLLLAGADFLLQPSLNENTGNAIVEALVAGVPVLSTSTCGYSEHIEQSQAGKIIESSPFNQQEMNTVLREMLMYPNRAKWQKKAIEYTDRTDLYNRISVIADLIENFGRKK